VRVNVSNPVNLRRLEPGSSYIKRLLHLFFNQHLVNIVDMGVVFF